MDKQALLIHREAALKAVHQIAKENCIENPKITAKIGSKNGDNYSGEVFQITITDNNDE